jgi:NADPH:quinone reductase-like Zn-dependent oxidoreductase
MKAIQLHQYGGAEVLQLEEVKKPVPQGNEVLIQLKAAALNPIDSKIRNGYMKEIIPLPLPFIPGWEGAGIVVSTGPDAREFKTGDEVITRVPFGKGGAYGEYMLAGENEVIAKPKSLSFADAASLPIVASAAYTLLFKTGHLTAGQKVFILGAAGSVGLLAVQMAKNAGAIVIGTAKGADREKVLAAGADHVVDYTNPHYAEAIQEVDLALDLVGGPAQDALWKLLKKGGQLLSTTMPPPPEKAKEFGVSAAFVFTQTDKPVMEKVAEMADKGIIRTNIGKTLPLAQASQAHALMDSGTVQGKIILEIN